MRLKPLLIPFFILGAALAVPYLTIPDAAPTAEPRALAAVRSEGGCPVASASLECASAHAHEGRRTATGRFLRREVRGEWSKPADWDEKELGAYIEGTPYPLGNLFWVDLGPGGQMSFWYEFRPTEDADLLIAGSRGAPLVAVTYDSHCGLALEVSLLPDPEPTPEPSPAPTPKPAPECPRKQPMPRSESGRNRVTAELWSRRCRRAEELRGDFERFEYAP